MSLDLEYRNKEVCDIDNVIREFKYDFDLTDLIGFPCISTGIFGYPKDEACKIAINTIKEYANENIEIKFVCYEELDYKLYINYLNRAEKGVF